MGIYVTNWPGRISYLTYRASATTTSGTGITTIQTNSWFDCLMAFRHGPAAADLMTNTEVIVGLLDSPAVTAGNTPRDGVFFLRRPAGAGPGVDWAAVITKGNAPVASNRLGWVSGTNEWIRLGFYGSSNAIVFCTNGIPAITNSGLALQTNVFFPTLSVRSVVTNTTHTFSTNVVFLDWLNVKE
jgi:hypothetical protein